MLKRALGIAAKRLGRRQPVHQSNGGRAQRLLWPTRQSYGGAKV